MVKAALGPINCLYPMPTTLIGTTVEERPNIVTIAHVGIVTPQGVSLGMNKAQYTNAGIKKNGTFSINIPNMGMVEETDYCDLVSGRQEDKSRLFTPLLGQLKTAPMIRECPVNRECRRERTVEFPTHDIFVGEVENTYADDSALTGGHMDIGKVQPILFTMGDREYWKIGERFTGAWEIGRGLMKRREELP
jgi:flavin reductase (DIM6/NTAB) family NADH-FMN oxidoreductase RutF